MVKSTEQVAPICIASAGDFQFVVINFAIAVVFTDIPAKIEKHVTMIS